MKRYSWFCLAGISVLVLAGCSTKADPGLWKHPSKPNSEWGRDYSGCQSYARREVDRDAGVHAGSVAEETRSTGLVGSFERIDARKRQNELVRYCMVRLGYSHAKP